jgi:transposase
MGIYQVWILRYFCGMPFLRVEKKKSGTYIRILESYRNDDGKSTHRILHSLGKVEDYTPEQLRSLGIKLYQLGGGEVKNLLKGDVQELGRYNYGYQMIYSRALKHYGLHDVFRRIARKAKLSFDLPNALMLMLLERLQEPCSKRASFFNQNEYLNLPKIELHHLYRTLDKLDANSQLIQQHIYQTGRDLFNSKLDVVFYDVTTFYFESDVETEGDLRQKGFGKDGKIGRTQILFSMLIDKDKNPIGYRVYKGNTYEGDTFEQALNDLKISYDIEKVIVVADRGMLSKKNVTIIDQMGYEFILGERLKTLPKEVKHSLIDLSKYTSEWIYNDHTGETVTIKYTTLEYGDKTIICTYSSKRAKKDEAERLAKVEKAKSLLNNVSALKTKQRRYFIKQTTKDKYVLDQAKIDDAAAYDGFLAIATNTTLSATTILENYKQLFKIEHSFRTFKSHLETRPMFHWTDARIKGHICLCYIAFCLQNYVLQKVNKTQIKITESSLRKTLDKMQISLIQTEKDQLFMKSAPTELEPKILHGMGLKPLLPLVKPKDLII